ncbi:hypothetical protein LTR10_016183 [Elasticomyces elasticus]|uniref:C2H2-type domain-containing protein n=1 Tax=Exophiala sideris TaxID=1016849 RepID=A0ABR0JF49_9EURO|nr:hypothetical protein LTR10_016183 [Elasticomyces elasticus]KAK5027630.1 hypothetical protein LTR13_009563 [Exophiala sideris]KAK5032808.1 hypothetical protein LTS07_004218 [Exophiala sideris]KAK5062332.1 hypothetical protein LTR69_004690 [Exophiala sideris]KAK5177490.1 hypothetical protein LTR44_009900 [Eurotiomycetes sp. CCFEE 6388]
MSANENHQMGDDDPRLAWPQGSATTTSDNLIAFSDLTWPVNNNDDLATDHRDLSLLLQPLTHFEFNNHHFDDSLLAPDTEAIDFNPYSHHPLQVPNNFHTHTEDPEELALRALEVTDFGDLHVPASATYGLGGGMWSLEASGTDLADGMGHPQGVDSSEMGVPATGYLSDGGPAPGAIPEYGFVLAGAPNRMEVLETHRPAQVGYPDPDLSNAGPIPTLPSNDATYPDLEPFQFNVADAHPVPYLPVGGMEADPTGADTTGMMETDHGFDEFDFGDFDFSAVTDPPYAANNTAVNIGLGITYDYGNVTPSGADDGVSDMVLPDGATQNNDLDNKEEEVDVQGLDNNAASHNSGSTDAYDSNPVALGDPVTLDDDPMSILYTRPGRRARFDEEMDDVPDVPDENGDSTSAADTADTNKPPARRLPNPRGRKRKAPADEEDDAEQEVNNAGAVKDTNGHYPSTTAVLLASSAREVDVTEALNDPAVPKNFKRKLPTVADEPDPFTCHICYHTFIREGRLKDHYLEKHPELRLTKKTVKDYEPAQIKNMHRLSWYIARGDDTTYTGTDRKQFNARRRMAAGIKTDSKEYLDDVYKKTPAVRAAANNAAQPKKAKKTQE